MKHVTWFVFSVLLLAPAAGGQPAAGRRVGLALGLQLSYAGSKANLTAEAEKMPDADFGLKPGSMPEVRTFGQDDDQ
jgi:hypothetical protein